MLAAAGRDLGTVTAPALVLHGDARPLHPRALRRRPGRGAGRRARRARRRRRPLAVARPSRAGRPRRRLPRGRLTRRENPVARHGQDGERALRCRASRGIAEPDRTDAPSAEARAGGGSLPAMTRIPLILLAAHRARRGARARRHSGAALSRGRARADRRPQRRPRAARPGGLQASAPLSRAADAHTRDMLARDFFDHASSDGTRSTRACAATRRRASSARRSR